MKVLVLKGSFWSNTSSVYIKFNSKHYQWGLIYIYIYVLPHNTFAELIFWRKNRHCLRPCVHCVRPLLRLLAHYCHPVLMSGIAGNHLQDCVSMISYVCCSYGRLIFYRYLFLSTNNNKHFVHSLQFIWMN